MKVYKYTKYIFFVLAIVTLAIASYLFNQQLNKQNEQQFLIQIKKEINDFNNKTDELNKSEVINFNQATPFSVYLFQNDTAKEWNNNDVEIESLQLINKENDLFIIKQHHQFFIVKSIIQNDSQNIVYAHLLFDNTATVFDIDNGHNYPFNIPVSLANENSKKINSVNDLTADDFIFNNGEPVNISPNNQVILFVVLFVIFMFTSLLSIIFSAYFRYNHIIVWSVQFIISLLAIGIILSFDFLPFHLDQTKLFSPYLLSSANYFNSLGEILIMSVLTYVQFVMFRLNIGKKLLKSYSPKVSQAIVIILIVIHILFFAVVNSNALLIIIKDSQLSFEFYDINRVSLMSFIALFIMLLNVSTLINIIYNIKKLISILEISKKFIYPALLIIFELLIFIFLGNPFETVHLYFVIIFIILIVLSHFYDLPIDFSFVEYRANYNLRGILWFILVSGFLTLTIYYFDTNKEIEFREQLADNLMLKSDFIGEAKYLNDINEIAEDSAINELTLIQKSKESAEVNFDLFDVKNIQFLSENDIKHDFNDSIYKNLYRFDQYVDFKIKEGKYVILATIELQNQTKYLYTHLAPKKDYIDIILQENYRDALFVPNYSVANYHNGILLNNSKNAVVDVDKKSLFQDDLVIKNSLYKSTILKGDYQKQRIVIVYERNIPYTLFSIFTYAILVYFFILLLYLFIRESILYSNKTALIIKRKLLTSRNWLLRQKIIIGFVITILFTALAFSITSVYFFKNNILDKQQNQIKQEVKLFQNATNTFFNFYKSGNQLGDSTINEKALREFYSYLEANIQGIDFSFYNINGLPFEFNKHTFLLDKKIINQNIANNNNQILTGIAKDNDDKYNYSLLTLPNHQKVIVAYIFKINNEQNNKQTASLVSILINVFIFIIIIILTIVYIFANTLTSNFTKISDQFSKTQLNQESEIQYPNNDELGVLVKAYNAMVKKVAVQAKELANNERVGAWKEVAQQVAHEINNPITPIKLHIQQLQKIAEREEQTPSSLYTQKISTSLLEQINSLQLLSESFSKYASLPEPSFSKENIYDICKKIYKLYLNSEDYEMEFDYEYDYIIVTVDPKILNLCIVNLIKNAIQATEEKENALIKLNLKLNNKEVFIEVEDNGDGINPDLMEKIFLPNFTTKSSGKGIGLSMTQRFITSMNGTIFVESTEMVGTKFIITLPLT